MNIQWIVGFTMSVNFGWWIVPLILSCVCLYYMLRPSKDNKGRWGIIRDGLEAGFKLLWLIPILFVWLVYAVIRLMFGIT